MKKVGPPRHPPNNRDGGSVRDVSTNQPDAHPAPRGVGTRYPSPRNRIHHSHEFLPAAGDTPVLEVQALNLLKNRAGSPALPTINSKITSAALIAPGNYHMRWKTTDGAEIVGYVADIKVGGVESCNCHAKGANDRDTHIELGLNPMDGAAKRVIVEVTPRWRTTMKSKGIDCSTTGLRNHIFRVGALDEYIVYCGGSLTGPFGNRTRSRGSEFHGQALHQAEDRI